VEEGKPHTIHFPCRGGELVLRKKKNGDGVEPGPRGDLPFLNQDIFAASERAKTKKNPCLGFRT